LTLRRAGRSSAVPPGRARDPLDARRREFDRYFQDALTTRCRAPGALGRAIRYAALSKGKRVRPLLTLATCEAVGGRWRAALPAAAAVECIHAFSLVHDDLPALDDDDYRRGRLTTHKKFGEAIAILAGDALLAFAFEELMQLALNGRVSAERVATAVHMLAQASGGERLVGGQALDLAAEGKRPSVAMVRQIHWNKTGALIGAAMGLGAIVGGASVRTSYDLQSTGGFLGVGFQIQDDLLNAGSSLRKLGKRAGSDAARGKATWPRAVGVEESRLAARTMLDLTTMLIRKNCRRPRVLLALIGEVAERQR
jgi:geranylgeranyl diphosphate synthase type II